MQDVTLTSERESAIKDLCDAATREVILTGRLLDNKLQPIIAKDFKDYKMLLRERLSYFARPEILGQLVNNMKLNRVQERYMELMGIEQPDYTIDISAMSEKRQVLVVTPFDALLKKMQPGRNDPCICGSGKKWKKCCGRH